MKYAVSALVLVCALAGCSKSNDLHDAMEDMKGPFKTMRESDDIAQIQLQITSFKEAVAKATEQKVKAEDQATFDEGMNELASLLAQAETALASGDLTSAKDLMKKMGGARKQYHDDLGVK